MKTFSRFFFISSIFLISTSSCNEINEINPNSSNFNIIDAALNEDNELEKYSKQLGFKVVRDYSKKKDEFLEFESLKEAKLFLKLAKSGDKNDELKNLLERNFKKESKNGRINTLKNSDIIKTIDESLSVSAINGCQSWGKGHYGSTGFAAGLLNFGINLTGNGTVSNTSSWLSGWTLGVAWQQQWIQSATKDAGGNVTVIVYGSAIYSLFFESVGTLHSVPVIYQIRITCDGHVSVNQIHQ